jgi:hypothetical protein
MQLKAILYSLIFCCFLSSCVSESDHEKVLAEKEKINQEAERLKQEIDDLKFGAPNLLAAGKQLYESKEYTLAREKFQQLVDRHPAMPQAVEAKKYLSVIDEEDLWHRASTNEDISLLEQYASTYPKGKYFSQATVQYSRLKKINLQKAYDHAADQNTSSGWKTFLEQYPDHKEASAIRKKIIRLEVDEISASSTTGQMPAFQQSSYGYSSSSSVQIRNDTNCELTVRYSGPDAKMIVIPVDGTESVNLPSGHYRITASACGEHYANTESLGGKYTSRFYISRTTY